MPLAKAAPVAQIEYADWTDVNHLRHSKFIALRDDKPAKDVKRGHRSAETDRSHTYRRKRSRKKTLGALPTFSNRYPSWCLKS
jgi:ATP-dependent DNA ligase